MTRVAVDVLLKREILDPEGRAVERALPDLGHGAVRDVRVGRHIELEVEATGADLEERMRAMCEGFLANPVIESYRWRVIDEHERADA